MSAARPFPRPLEAPPIVRVGMLGCGVVGASTARILQDHAEDIAQRAGAAIELRRVAVRDVTKVRPVALDGSAWTDDPYAVVRDPEIDVVVELIGGVDPARDLLVEAARRGKHVVSANKEVLSSFGREVMSAAEESGVDLLFEASVAGGIPIIRPLKESLAGDRVRRVMGIVNGTTNFVLTRMSETGASFETALAEARRLGYAEADPSADIEGRDAAAKLAILASIAFNARVVIDDVVQEGIAGIRAEDVAAAHDLGYEIKLLAAAERDGEQISARVQPAMVPQTHPLASVRGVFNAVFVEAEEAGELMFLGRGAGGPATGAAVVGDIVEIARNLASGGRSAGCTCYLDRARIEPRARTRMRFYVVLAVVDRPGVLASVAGVFARHGVSIASVRQEGFGVEARLAIITHVSDEGSHTATFAGLARLDVVKRIESTIRVMGTDEG
jgi:homoserine dehydrogenase